MAISLGFHVIGIVLWIGSLMVLTRLVLTRQKLSGTIDSAEAQALQRLWTRFGGIGFVCVLLSGFHQLFARGASFYMQQGWFHGKLGAVLVLIALSGVFHVVLHKLQSGEQPRAATIHVVHALTGVLLLVIVFSTFIGLGRV